MDESIEDLLKQLIKGQKALLAAIEHLPERLWKAYEDRISPAKMKDILPHLEYSIKAVEMKVGELIDQEPKEISKPPREVLTSAWIKIINEWADVNEVYVQEATPLHYSSKASECKKFLETEYPDSEAPKLLEEDIKVQLLRHKSAFAKRKKKGTQISHTESPHLDEPESSKAAETPEPEPDSTEPIHDAEPTVAEEEQEWESTLREIYGVVGFGDAIHQAPPEKRARALEMLSSKNWKKCTPIVQVTFHCQRQPQ